MAKPTRVINATDYKTEIIEKKIEAVETVTDNSSFQQGIIDTVYPIGSIMMRYDTMNPKTLPGFNATSWTQLSTGKYILSSSSAGSTGGSSTTDGTSITTAMMPSHSHSFSATTGNNSVGHSHSLNITSGSSGTHSHSVPGKTTGVAGGRIYDSSGSQIFDPAVFIGGCHHSYGGTGSSSIWIGHYNCTPGGTKYDDNFYLGTETHTTESHSGHTHVITGSSGTDSVNHTHSVSGTTASNGSGSAHTHTYSPPYIAVVVWRRIE